MFFSKKDFGVTVGNSRTNIIDFRDIASWKKGIIISFVVITKLCAKSPRIFEICDISVIVSAKLSTLVALKSAKNAHSSYSIFENSPLDN